MAMRVRAVVVCWNNRDLLPRTLERLLATTWSEGDLHVVVVDNGSTDGSVDDWADRFPHVELRRTGRNLGFGVVLEGSNDNPGTCNPISPDPGALGCNRDGVQAPLDEREGPVPPADGDGGRRADISRRPVPEGRAGRRVENS